MYEIDIKKKIINDDWLIENYLMVTKQEYIIIHPEGNYDKFLQKFYWDGVLQAFNCFNNRDWFKDRYLNDNCVTPSHNSTHLFYEIEFLIVNVTMSDYWYFICGNTKQKNIKDCIKQYLNVEGVNNVYIRQNNEQEKFVRDFYISSSKEQQLNKGYQIQFTGIQENYRLSSITLRRILKVLSFMYNKQYIWDKYKSSPLTVIEITAILRNEFYFCTTCGHKSDTFIEMYDKCNVHNNKTIEYRQLGMISDLYDFDFTAINYAFKELQIRKYIKKERNEFECNECKKKFISFETIESHLENKHKDIYENITQLTTKFNLFITRIDLFILDWIGQVTKNKNKKWNNYPRYPPNTITYPLNEYYCNIK